MDNGACLELCVTTDLSGVAPRVVSINSACFLFDTGLKKLRKV
jgi:hypothetical protein